MRDTSERKEAIYYRWARTSWIWTGGTGAAPEIAKKNIAMPIAYAIPEVHRFLEQKGIREEVSVQEVLLCKDGSTADSRDAYKQVDVVPPSVHADQSTEGVSD